MGSSAYLDVMFGDPDNPVDQTLKSIGTAYNKDLDAFSRVAMKAIDTVATRSGIDKNYFRYLLFKAGSPSWPKMPPKTRVALRAAIDIATLPGIPNVRAFDIAEDESRVDQAFAELVKWANGGMANFLFKRLIATITIFAKEIVRKEPDLTLRKLVPYLYGKLKQRVSRHTMMFDNRHLLNAILNSVLA